MGHAAHERPEDYEHPLRDHETTDIDVLGIVKFLGVLFAGGVVIYVVLGLMWHSMSSDEQRMQRSAQRELPPGPRLQVAPRSELIRYYGTQKERVETYGWVDKSAGLAHIPITQALDEVAAAGLPVRQQGVTPAGRAAPPVPAKEKRANVPRVK